MTDTACVIYGARDLRFEPRQSAPMGDLSVKVRVRAGGICGSDLHYYFDGRNGDYVIVALTVGTDGRVRACRVHRPSRDAAADRITCELATRRFRFKPATDRNGQPVEAVFGWQQRWFEKEEN